MLKSQTMDSYLEYALQTNFIIFFLKEQDKLRNFSKINRGEKKSRDIAHAHLDGGENPKVIFREISEDVHIKLHCSSSLKSLDFQL